MRVLSKEFPLCSSVKSMQHSSNLNDMQVYKTGCFFCTYQLQTYITRAFISPFITRLFYAALNSWWLHLNRFSVCFLAFPIFILQVVKHRAWEVLGRGYSYGLAITLCTLSLHCSGVQLHGCVTTQLMYHDINIRSHYTITRFCETIALLQSVNTSSKNGTLVIIFFYYICYYKKSNILT